MVEDEVVRYQDTQFKQIVIKLKSRCKPKKLAYISLQIVIAEKNVVFSHIACPHPKWHYPVQKVKSTIRDRKGTDIKKELGMASKFKQTFVEKVAL